MTNNLLNGMFGKIQAGMCKLSMNGGIAVKTSSGYKTYNIKTNKLTQCSNFVLDGFDSMFFVIPTNKVEKGDIIIVNGKPKAIIKASKDEFTAINYETGVVETQLPERHVFMGNTYFYGKIVSLFSGELLRGKKGVNNVLQFMMISEMMKGGNGASMFGGGNSNSGGMNALLPLMLMNGSNGIGTLFSGIFDNEDDEEENIVSKLMKIDEEEENEEE